MSKIVAANSKMFHTRQVIISTSYIMKIRVRGRSQTLKSSRYRYLVFCCLRNTAVRDAWCFPFFVGRDVISNTSFVYTRLAIVSPRYRALFLRDLRSPVLSQSWKTSSSIFAIAITADRKEAIIAQILNVRMLDERRDGPGHGWTSLNIDIK